MKNKNKKIVAVIVALLACVVFFITFVDSPYVPTWFEIFGIKAKCDPDADIISFIDVGQGDCVLIQSNGRFALIDFGDGNTENISRICRRKGIEGFDAVMVSHWHNDHYGGIYDILDSFEVLNAVLPSPNNEVKDTYGDVRAALDKNEVMVHFATVGMVINIGEVEITVLYTNPDANNENDRSVALMARCHDKKFLFTGDSEKQAEKAIIDKRINIDCDVFKAAHHGSNTSNTSDFLDKCTPEFSVISVGYNNKYSHPSSQVLERLYFADSKVYRTDYDGTVAFDLTDSDIIITTQN